jgi:hypothetical protein
MKPSDLSPGVLAIDRMSYRGKHYLVPRFDPNNPVVLHGQARAPLSIRADDPIIRCLNSTWDLAEFLSPRQPLSLGLLSVEELAAFAQPGAVRVLDLPIQMPGSSEVRLPSALSQFSGAIQRIIDIEHQLLDEHTRTEYHAYLTIDQRWVAPGALHREAPCHVDGFQGARWQPKCKTNHTYTVSDLLPTAYYLQPFDFRHLDDRLHDYFWEMNAQVADTHEAHKWQPQAAELTMMDCYCVHRGVENETDKPVFRTWLRLSFEERRRVFDRLGNAHNPLFDYAWDMVDRDIEQLGLVAFRADSHPSLRVFPWQDEQGQALPHGKKTKPRLRG